LIEGLGIHLPPWVHTGYRTALLSADPATHGLLTTAPHVGGFPILIHVPAFAIVMVITWLLLQGARESATANNIMVVIKLLALGLFVAVGATHINPANYHPFVPNGFRGIHQGAAIVFFAYIGFDAISTAAEETTNPQRNLPLGILGGLAICTLIYDAGETYDLTNIGTLFAFMLVSIGVLVLRYKEPERPRPFRVPFVWPVCVLSALGCVYIMLGLPDSAWRRFGGWLMIG